MRGFVSKGLYKKVDGRFCKNTKKICWLDVSLCMQRKFSYKYVEMGISFPEPAIFLASKFENARALGTKLWQWESEKESRRCLCETTTTLINTVISQWWSNLHFCFLFFFKKITLILLQPCSWACLSVEGILKTNTSRNAFKIEDVEFLISSSS